MRRFTLIFIVFLGFLTWFSFGFLQQDTNQLFQSALYEEEVTGVLEKAIVLYHKILEVSEDVSLAAKAQFQIGACYEKLGKKEAIKAYELLLEKYPGQIQQVAAARARLAVLKRDPSESSSEVELNFFDPEYSLDAFDLSPDGTKMLGVEFTKGQNIVIRDLASNKIKFITDYDWYKDYHWTYHPAWAPNGKEIVYFAKLAEKGKIVNSLRVTDQNGQVRVFLNSGTSLFAPNVWMPDGKSILVVKGNPDNSQELGLVPSAGGEFKNLVNLKGNVQGIGRNRASACVSPEGRFIAFTESVSEENNDIFIISSNGKESWPLITHPAEEKYPRWSPDGKHIVFLSLRHGSWALRGVAVNDGKA